MNSPLQITPARSAAAICTLLWFALWMLAFRPEPIHPAQSASRPNAALRPADPHIIPDFRNPSLFALPSRKGFSGTFPPVQINLALQFDTPRQSAIELPPGPIRKGDPAPSPLFKPVAFPEPKDHAPEASTLNPLVREDRIQFFFSPKLKARMSAPPELELPEERPGERPTSIHIQLSVRPDGSVEQAFFDPPAESAELITAIKTLRFKPGPHPTAGRLELRLGKGGS